jgi:formiminotetrahydrofolate cyclodeaminase
MAAALLEKVARLSGRHWLGATEARERATAMREAAVELVDADATAYAEFVNAKRGDPGLDLEAAHALTIEVPMRTARVAAETVELAWALAQFGNPNLRPDAQVAGQLALAGAQAALITMTANLPDSPRDERLIEARRLVRSASGRLRSPGAPGSAGGPGRGRARSADKRQR